MARSDPFFFVEDTKNMNWIVNILLITATIAVVLLWYLLHQIFSDSPPPPAGENETLTP